MLFELRGASRLAGEASHLTKWLCTFINKTAKKVEEESTGLA